MAEVTKLGDKVKITLLDNSIILLPVTDIKQTTQNMGEITPIYNICGIHPIFGPGYCLKCIAENNLEGCGRYYIYGTSKGEPGPIEIQLKNGSVLYAKDFKLVENNAGLFIQPDGPESKCKYTWEE